MTIAVRGTLALLAALATLMPAQAYAEVKIGVVDQRRGILTTVQGKEASQNLEALAEQKQREMEPRQKTYQQKQEEIESQRFVLSRDVLQERLMELEKEKRELERDVSAAQDDLQLQERKMLRPILEKWQKAVREIGSERNFDLIIDRSTPGVLFFEEALDITDMVVQRVDKMK